MDSKTCTKCGIPKPLNEFHNWKDSPDGKIRYCKSCRALNNSRYRKANPEKYSTRNKAWKKANPEKVHAGRKAWQKANPEKFRAGCKAWKKANPEKTRAIIHAWIKANPEKHRNQKLAWRKANPEKVRLILLRSNKKKASTPQGKLNINISSSIRSALHNAKQGRHWEDLVGFTLEQLKRHIEKQFTAEMSWKRYIKGDIHLDHKIPITAFNFETPEDIDFKKCWSLKNLRPMWALENIKKGAKVEHPFQPSLLLHA